MSVDSEEDTDDNMGKRETDNVATEEEESPPEPSVKVEEVGTAPFDWRFPTANQTRHCYSRYLEYHKSLSSLLSS
ncbi:hypothetical protein RHGRI_030889 [Rhododendron griersonianum]|uniref:Cytochrome c oxidase subunit 6b-1 n=1 Tax=Rhododendron griersonianum TaxID=479676 RepID=A0AAV6I6A8_9ERIC|nr:hypothetical protein RHGRI_030889 [Rhododendron griersonianum]